MNRRGNLSDAQTLRLYEQGQPLIALALAEGLTPYGVLVRVGRERARRRERGVLVRTKRPQPAFDSLLALADAMDDLSVAIERIAPTREARASRVTSRSG